jgi:GxxExxY protein
MDADGSHGVPAPLTGQVIGVFYAVYNELGPGFLEWVYSAAMRVALEESGLRVQSEVALPVRFRGHMVGEFRADLLIEGKLLVEIKAATAIIAAHHAQVINYLRASGLPLGLIMNFGPKPMIKRLVHTPRPNGGTHTVAESPIRAS